MAAVIDQPPTGTALNTTIFILENISNEYYRYNLTKYFRKIFQISFNKYSGLQMASIQNISPVHQHGKIRKPGGLILKLACLLAPTGAFVVAPLPLFHITSSRSSKSLYNLLTLLKKLEHLCQYK